MESEPGDCGALQCKWSRAVREEQERKIRMAAEFGQILVRENAKMKAQIAQLGAEVAEECEGRRRAQEAEKKAVDTLRGRLAESLKRNMELEHQVGDLEEKLSCAEQELELSRAISLRAKVHSSNEEHWPEEEEQKCVEEFPEKAGVELVDGKAGTELRDVKRELRELQVLYQTTCKTHNEAMDEICQENDQLRAAVETYKAQGEKVRLAQDLGKEEQPKDSQGLQRRDQEDPMFFHFHLLVQSVRITLDKALGYSDHISESRDLSARSLYERALDENIPFFEFQPFIERAYTNMLERFVSAPSEAVEAARALLRAGVITRGEYDRIAQADRQSRLE